MEQFTGRKLEPHIHESRNKRTIQIEVDCSGVDEAIRKIKELSENLQEVIALESENLPKVDAAERLFQERVNGSNILTHCPNCNSLIYQSNFCCHCGQKILKVCNCWVTKQEYDCGMSKCPGHNLSGTSHI